METIKGILEKAVRWGVFIAAIVDALQVIIDKIETWEIKKAEKTGK